MNNRKGVGALLIVALIAAMLLVTLPVMAAEMMPVAAITNESVSPEVGEGTYSPVDEGVYFPSGGDIFFVDENYQVSWTYSDTYGTPLISIGIVSASNDTSPLDAEWAVVRYGTIGDGSYNWCVPSMETGEYKLIIVLDYQGMMGTYHQDVLYSDDFYIINATT